MIFSILFMPAAGRCENLRFVFLADSRGDSHKDLINSDVLSAIVEKITELSPKPSFVVFGGDQAHVHDFADFQKIMQPLTKAGIKLYTTLGNHELYSEGVSGFLFLNQRQFQLYFTGNPINGPAGYARLVYSFESPGHDAVFVILDPYYLTQNMPAVLSGTFDSAQLSWLLQKLAATKATHKFIFTHAPFSYMNWGDPSDPEEGSPPPDITNTILWDIVDAYQFDMFLCGHQHLYSRHAVGNSTVLTPARTAPIYQNNVVQQLTGTCGAPIDTGNVQVDRTEWNVSNSADTYYFSVMDIAGDTVTVTSYKGFVDKSKYAPFDCYTIQKNGTAPQKVTTIACSE
jgi:hypothetical protein